MLEIITFLYEFAASPMLEGAVLCDPVTAVLGLGSALIGSRASKRAGDQAAASASEANALQQSQYDQTRADNEPWRLAGQNALNNLTGILNGSSKYASAAFTPQDLDNEPGYQFQREQGMRGIGNMADAFGSGGATLKAASRFNQGLAGTSYQNAFNRFQTERQNELDPYYRMAGYGSAANTQNSAAGANNANNQGANMMDAANAQGAAGISQGNIWSNALNQGAAAWNRRSTIPQPNWGVDQYGNQQWVSDSVGP